MASNNLVFFGPEQVLVTPFSALSRLQRTACSTVPNVLGGAKLVLARGDA